MDFSQMLSKARVVRAKYVQIERKRGQEWTGLNLAEGFVTDVGELMKLIMAKEGLREAENVDQKLSHELADCLWSLIVIADKYGVDLEKAFERTMNELERE